MREPPPRLVRQVARLKSSGLPRYFFFEALPADFLVAGFEVFLAVVDADFAAEPRFEPDFDAPLRPRAPPPYDARPAARPPGGAGTNTGRPDN